MNIGEFSFSVPIGHAFPLDNSDTSIGIASRFQWSSDGNAETTVVHIEELSITVDSNWNMIILQYVRISQI